MRKIMMVLILMLSISAPLYALEDGRTDKGVMGRELTVLGRGLLNIVGTPLEIIRTPIAETKMHKWAWPVTFIPRAVTNILIRATSAVNDIVVYPWVVPSTDDLSPLTES